MLHNAQAGGCGRLQRAPRRRLRPRSSPTSARPTSGDANHRAAPDDARNISWRKPVDVRAVVRESLALVSQEAAFPANPDRRRFASKPCSSSRGPRALAAGAGEPDDERHRGDDRDTAGSGCPREARRAGPTTSRSPCGRGNGTAGSVDGRLFEPFVTTKTNGLGVGLTIARHHRRSPWRHRRRPQQPRRGRDLPVDAAARRGFPPASVSSSCIRPQSLPTAPAQKTSSRKRRPAVRFDSRCRTNVPRS